MIGLFLKRELEDKLNQQINEYKQFEQIFLEILNIRAPIKKKLFRADHVPYMTKALRKGIMKRSELESNYVKNNTNENLKSYKMFIRAYSLIIIEAYTLFCLLKSYKKQRNFCSKLYKKERKKYYERLDLNNVTDNKKFWKTVKPFFSDKVTSFLQITLVENDEIISDESKVTNSFSKFFDNAVQSLGIKTNEYSNDNYGLKNPVETAIKKYEQHPSILLKKILQTMKAFISYQLSRRAF